MKNFRFFSLVLLFAMTSVMITGCQPLKDLFGIGPAKGSGIPVPPPPIEDPTDITMLPEDLPPGPITPREGEWKTRPDLALPTIYFSYDKFSIGLREKQILDQVADYMQKNPVLGIIVEGHCDERGSDEYNRALGERRALAVHDYLVSIGIPSDRIQTQSYGEERPAVPGSDESAYSKNRRAELILAEM